MRNFQALNHFSGRHFILYSHRDQFNSRCVDKYSFVLTIVFYSRLKCTTKFNYFQNEMKRRIILHRFRFKRRRERERERERVRSTLTMTLTSAESLFRVQNKLCRTCVCVCVRFHSKKMLLSSPFQTNFILVCLGRSESHAVNAKAL